MRLKPIQLRGRPAVRRPLVASLGPAGLTTAKSRKPHRDRAEKRRDPVDVVVLHTAGDATDSAIRPVDNGMIPGLPGNELSLQACQHQLSFGHRQIKVGNIAEVIGAVDMHDVDPSLRTVRPGFHQPYSPSHASTPYQRPGSRRAAMRPATI